MRENNERFFSFDLSLSLPLFLFFFRNKRTRDLKSSGCYSSIFQFPLTRTGLLSFDIELPNLRYQSAIGCAHFADSVVRSIIFSENIQQSRIPQNSPPESGPICSIDFRRTFVTRNGLGFIFHLSINFQLTALRDDQSWCYISSIISVTRQFIYNASLEKSQRIVLYYYIALYSLYMIILSARST